MVAIGDIIPFLSTKNSEHYIKRTQEPYKPTTLQHFTEVRHAVPKHLHERPLLGGLWVFTRDYLVCAFFFWAALRFDTVSTAAATMATGDTEGMAYLAAKHGLKTSLWLLYWWWTGLQFAGIWFNGHEASHGNLSVYNWVNDSLGLITHMSILNPYFSWKVSHKLHHKGSGHVEREDSYVPIFRKMYLEDNPQLRGKLLKPSPRYHTTVKRQADEREKATGSRFSMIYDALDDVPMYVLFARFVVTFTAGWNGYIMFNIGGNRTHRPGASHFLPNSPLFEKQHGPFVILSDLAILSVLYVLYDLGKLFGFWNLFVFYGIPYLVSNFVLTWVTVLQHIDATVPHYRGKDWTYVKGSLATIDRDFFGWQGLFFVHGASRYHVAHHLFPEMPWRNAGAATKVFASMLGDAYCYDNTPPLWALWRTWHECQFIEEEDGDTLFFRDRVGRARRGMGEVAPAASKHAEEARAESGDLRMRRPRVD